MERSMVFENVHRSWRLVKASLVVVADVPVLLLFPLLGALTMLVVVASFAVPVLAGGFPLDPEQWIGGTRFLVGLALFLLYLVLFFVGMFFSTALAGLALLRLEGREAGIGTGLALAARRARSVLGYAVIAATVGLVLQSIEERVGWVGRLVTGFIGATWSVATFLVVPLLAARDVSAVAALRESVLLLKTSWGENIVGRVGFGAAFGLAFVLLVVVGSAGTMALYAFSSMAGDALLLACLVAFLALLIVRPVLQAVYAAALYRHVTGAGATAGFPQDLLAAAFVTRPRK